MIEGLRMKNIMPTKRIVNDLYLSIFSNLRRIINNIYYNNIIQKTQKFDMSKYLLGYWFPFLYPGCGFSIPRNKKLVRQINIAAERLYRKIINLDISKLGISDYNKKYLTDKKKILYIEIQKYSYLLSWILSKYNYDLSKCCFLDYGGGTGLLSLLALEAGIKNVYYNDIYDVSCRDAAVIAKAVHLKRKDYIQGDLDDIIQYCKNTGIYFNAIGSYDVIEHIYDIKYFFLNIDKIAHNKCTIFMISGANPYNKKIKNELMLQHKKLENESRNKYYGWKQRDTLESYHSVRKRIIEQYIDQNNIKLKQDEIQLLSKYTRGMVKQDIEKSVDQYIKNGVLPEIDKKFPTNTCDPYTGNWAEHLMDFDMLINILKTTNFKSARVVPDKDKLSSSDIIGIFASK